MKRFKNVILITLIAALAACGGSTSTSVSPPQSALTSTKPATISGTVMLPASMAVPPTDPYRSAVAYPVLADKAAVPAGQVPASNVLIELVETDDRGRVSRIIADTFASDTGEFALEAPAGVAFGIHTLVLASLDGAVIRSPTFERNVRIDLHSEYVTRKLLTLPEPATSIDAANALLRYARAFRPPQDLDLEAAVSWLDAALGDAPADFAESASHVIGSVKRTYHRFGIAFVMSTESDDLGSLGGLGFRSGKHNIEVSSAGFHSAADSTTEVSVAQLGLRAGDGAGGYSLSRNPVDPPRNIGLTQLKDMRLLWQENSSAITDISTSTAVDYSGTAAIYQMMPAANAGAAASVDSTLRYNLDSSQSDTSPAMITRQETALGIDLLASPSTIAPNGDYGFIGMGFRTSQAGGSRNAFIDLQGSSWRVFIADGMANGAGSYDTLLRQPDLYRTTARVTTSAGVMPVSVPIAATATGHLELGIPQASMEPDWVEGSGFIGEGGLIAAEHTAQIKVGEQVQFDERTIALGIPIGASAADLTGKTYALIGIEVALASDGATRIDQTQRGHLHFQNATQATVSRTTMRLARENDLTDATFSTLEEAPTIWSYRSGAGGTLYVERAADASPLKGFVSPDASLLIVRTDDTGPGSLGLYIGVLVP